ncbi:hypothetical protein ACTFIW_001011 [Dictyostelium discoideum]
MKNATCEIPVKILLMNGSLEISEILIWLILPARYKCGYSLFSVMTLLSTFLNDSVRSVSLESTSRWSNTRSLNYVRKTLETMPQEESQFDWRAYSRILQSDNLSCLSEIYHKSSSRVTRILQSNPTSIQSNTDGSFRISPLKGQLLNKSE